MLKISVAWSLAAKQLNPGLDRPYLSPSDAASRLPHPALCPGSMETTYTDMNWLPSAVASACPLGSPRAKGSIKSRYLPPWLPACQLEKSLHLLKFPDCTQQSLFWLQELLLPGAPLGQEEVRELGPQEL